VFLEQYTNNKRPALQLYVVSENGMLVEPMMTASINAPEVSLGDEEIIIKDFAENHGILKVLAEAGIVTPTGRQVPLTHALGDVCKLNTRGLCSMLEYQGGRS